MRLTQLFAAVALSATVIMAQAPLAQAEDKVEVELEEREPVGVTKGPRCTFTRAEKLGMLLWIIPIAGAIYTPFACKGDVFDRKVDIDVN
jgi:hypothetical protein